MLEFEPNLRKQELFQLLKTLSDPHVTPDTLEKAVESECVPYVWRWQDDFEGNHFKDKTDVTSVLKDAANNLINLLILLIEHNDLPKVQVFEDKDVVIEGPPDEFDEEVSDTKASLPYEFRVISQEDAKFSIAALSFLFHAADGAGGAMYNIKDALDFTALGRVCCSLLQAVNVDVALAASRVLGQVVGASSYLPPPSVPHLLTSMALNVPCQNGSSAKVNNMSIIKFLNGEYTVEDFGVDIGQFTPETINSPQSIAQYRLAISINDQHQRDLLVSQQAYSIATLVILLGEHGFDKVVSTRAPNALVALVDVCRDDEGDSLVSYFVRASIVESLTIFLSFLGFTHNLRFFKRLQLGKLLAGFYKDEFDENYFRQLCDLASFAPNQAMINPLKLVQLSVSSKLSGECKLRALDVLARVLDQPESENLPVPEQTLEPIYFALFASVEHDLALLIKTGDGVYCRLVTERMEALNLFTYPLSWNYLERTLFKSNFIDTLIQILSVPAFMETLPTRALTLAAESLAHVCETEQARVLLLHEQGLKDKLYDTIITLSRANNRPLDLLKVIETLYVCMWGKNGKLYTGEHDNMDFDADDASDIMSDDDDEEEEAGVVPVLNLRTGNQVVFGESENAQQNNQQPQNQVSSSHNEDSTNRDESNSYLDKLDKFHLRMATEVIVDSVCRHMKELLMNCMPTLARSVVDSVRLMAKNALKHGINTNQWSFFLIESYLNVSEEFNLSFPNNITPKVFIFDKPLSVYSTKFARPLLRNYIFARKTSVSPSGSMQPFKPKYLENFLRLAVELATDNFPSPFVGVLKVFALYNSDDGQFVAKIVPPHLVAEFIFEYLKLPKTEWAAAEIRLTSAAFKKLPHSISEAILSQWTNWMFSLPVIHHNDINDNERDIVSSKATLLENFYALIKNEAFMERIDDIVYFAVKMLETSISQGENEDTTKILFSLVEDLLSKDASFEVTSSSLKNMITSLMTKGCHGNWLFDVLKLFPPKEAANICAAMWQNDQLHFLVKSSDTHVFMLSSKIHNHLEPLSIGEIIKYSVERGTSDMVGPEDRLKWLRFAHSMFRGRPIRTENIPLNFNQTVGTSVSLLMQKIGEGEYMSPDAFSCLKQLLFMSLMAEVSENAGTDGKHKDIPRAFGGVAICLPDREVLTKFVKASANAYLYLFSDYSASHSTGFNCELGILGLSAILAMLSRSDLQLSQLIIESGVVGTFVDCVSQSAEPLRSRCRRFLYGLSHVLTSSPAVMAGNLIEELNYCPDPEDMPHKESDYFLRGHHELYESEITPSRVLLMRYSELRSIPGEIFGIEADKNLVQWSVLEQSAKHHKVDMEKPKCLDLTSYPSLSQSSHKLFLDTLVDKLFNSKTPSHAKLSARLLFDQIKLTFRTRQLLLSNENRFVENLLLHISLQSSNQWTQNSTKTRKNDAIRLIALVLGALTELSKDEPVTLRTRKSLEKSTKIIMRAVLKMLEKEVPRLRRANFDQAVTLLHICTDVVQCIWGDSAKLNARLVWIRETYIESDPKELFHHKIMRDMKVIETLVGAYSLFNFSWDELSDLKLIALNFIDQLVFQELFTIKLRKPSSTVNGDGQDSNGDEGGSDDDDLDDIDVDDFNSSAEEEDELLETEHTEERRLQHRQRIEASHGNTFRNSSLGEYESSSDSMDEDDENVDILEEDDLMDDGGRFQSDDNGMHVDIEGTSNSESNHDGSEDDQDVEIMLVLSDRSSGDESSEESIDSSSSSASEDEEQIELVLTDQNEQSPHVEDTVEIQTIPNLDVDDEILLMYNERHDDENDRRNSQVPRRNTYFRSAFQSVEDDEGDETFAPLEPLQIDENSDLLFFSFNELRTCFAEALNTRLLEDAAIKDIKNHFPSEKEPYKTVINEIPQPLNVSFVPKYDGDAKYSSYLPQLLAMLGRVIFSEGLDIENEVIAHVVTLLANIPAGRDFISTLIDILFEASCGHIESVYASLTRIAVSASPYPLPNSELSCSPPSQATPALVCNNVLTILNTFFGASVIANDSEFLWNELNDELCEYKDVENTWLDYVHAVARRHMDVEGSAIVSVITRPVIARNKKLLELASDFMQKIIAATRSSWDPSAPMDDSEDEEDELMNDEIIKDEDKLHVEVEETASSRIIEVLSSKECNYRVFRNILGVTKKTTDTSVFVEPLVKELKKSKHVLSTGMRKTVDCQAMPGGLEEIKGTSGLFEDQLRFLRLLNVVGSLFDGQQCLTVFYKVDLNSLWGKVAKVIEIVQQQEGLVPEVTLSLLEVIAMPADIMYRVHEELKAQNQSTDAFETMINDVTTSLQQYLPKFGNIINELIRGKPNLLGGPLGSMAIKFNVVDFKNKTNWLSQQIWNCREEKYAGEQHTAVIDRDHIFEDSFELLSKMQNEELLYPMNIEFVNEPGVDEGGVAREWYEILSREIMNPMYGLFCPTVAGSSISQVNPLAEGNPDKEDIFRFVGRVIGRAIYDQYTVGLYFSRVVYKYFLGESISFSDMELVDESYYKSLRWMLDNDITDVFYETFSVDIDNFGETKTVDLIPNGRNVPVDESNKHEYVRLIVEYKLIGSVQGALSAMKEGLYDVLPETWVKMFSDQELELLISGLPTIDINDWAENTVYEGYTKSSRQVKWFWLAVESFNPEMRAKLLQFSTGTSRVPAQGFGHLESNTDSGKFVIHKENGSTDRLPSSHTCMNQISLPEYESYGKLRKLLLKAITEGGEGFGFA